MNGALSAEVTSFIGRRRELGEVRRLLSTARLVTLIGIGGVGKTRLATHAAAELRRAFPGGVRFVELADLADPALLPQTTAAAFGLRDESEQPVDRLADYLADEHVLLVLDNCEHVADACAMLIGKLLAASPQLKILATSRQRLGVEGEHLMTVEPLSVPVEHGEQEESGGYDSLSLFCERAGAVMSGFTLSPENRDVVAAICRRLDGLPLAIELAAVWMRALSLEEIHVRLGDKFTLLAGGMRTAHPRQQGLETLIDWSYRLCSPAERDVWAKLSVFRGGFDLAAAEFVCADEDVPRAEIVRLLADLVDKSILSREEDTYGRAARYRMIETLAQFGAARLAESGQSQAIEARHRQYYRELGKAFAAEEFGAGQLDWVLRLQREHANLRKALESWLAEPDPLPALELATDLSIFWIAGGLLAEGCRWLDRALTDDRIDGAHRARALHEWLILSSWLGVHRSFRSRIREYRLAVNALADPALLARFRTCEAIITYFLGDPAKACTLLSAALRECREAGEDALYVQSMPFLVVLKFILAEPDAERVGEEAVALCVERGRPPWHTAYALWSLGLAVWQRGDVDRAERLQRDAVRLRQPMNDHSGIALSLEALAWCAASAKRFARAARLLGAAAMVWRLSGAGRIEPALHQVSTTHCADVAREALGEEAFEREVAAGRSLSFEQAVTVALGERAASVTGNETPPERRLTRRETEIAALVAQGLSNKQIAAQLVIAQRTAESHVEHILTKLGFTSRTQIAAWFAAAQES